MWRVIAVAAFLVIGPLASMSPAQSVQEVRIRWDAYTAPKAPIVSPGTGHPSNVMAVLGRRQMPGSLPRQRNPELSADQLVVIAVNARGETVDSQLVPDPRVLRAEFPGPTGELSGQVLHHASTELLLTLPDDRAIVEIRLFQPRWTGTSFVLDYLATVPLP